MDEEQQLLLWGILLCIRRSFYARNLALWDERTLHLDDVHAGFLLDIILSGNYEEGMIEKVFSLSPKIQNEIRIDFLN